VLFTRYYYVGEGRSFFARARGTGRKFVQNFRLKSEKEKKPWEIMM
jgi:hypothetical protein